jgi:DNA-binding SARP family transcriptional activator
MVENSFVNMIGSRSRPQFSRKRLFSAKYMPPLASEGIGQARLLNQAAQRQITLFSAPPGYLQTEGLMQSLKKSGRRVVWLRVDSDDRDPGVFLQSLILAAQRITPEIGETTLGKMWRQPGPRMGWEPLFTTLAAELGEGLPESTALVIERTHHLNGDEPTFKYLGTNLLSHLPANFTSILTSNRSLPKAYLPPKTTLFEVEDLRLDMQSSLALVETTHAGLADDYLRRTLEVIDGREVLLCNLCYACLHLGLNFVEYALDLSKQLHSLLTEIARGFITAGNLETRRALAVMLRVGYGHPILIEKALGNKGVPEGPWLQSLEDHWARIRSIWQTPLWAALRIDAHKKQSFPIGSPELNASGQVLEILNYKPALLQAAQYLEGHGGIYPAMRLYMELEDYERASKMMLSNADELLNFGLWRTLDEWINSLPSALVEQTADLAYLKGELLSARGNLNAGRQSFARATSLYSAREETPEKVKSLLAESALAIQSGDTLAATSLAHDARRLSRSSGLTLQEGWAAWQLGYLAVNSGAYELGLNFFQEAKKKLPVEQVPGFIEHLEKLEALARKQTELQQQRERHLQAMLQAESQEQETSAILQRLARRANGLTNEVISSYGWTQTPQLMKLENGFSEQAVEKNISIQPKNRQSKKQSQTRVLSGLFSRMKEKLADLFLERGSQPAQNGSSEPDRLPFELEHELQETQQAVRVFAQPVLEPAPPEIPVEQIPQSHEIQPARDQVQVSEDSPRSAPVMTVYLLGAFRVLFNDQALEEWRSSRGKSILKYMLLHYPMPASRDALMETFWPDNSPDSARNSLNVAIHGLRRSFRPVTKQDVILYEDGAYSLNPAIKLWIDTVAFENHLQNGRRALASEDVNQGLAEFEAATSLYQGNLMEDDPYEDWPVIKREQLRMEYLEVLDTMSHFYFNQGQYSACVTLCKQILKNDRCREDAHCRLMRCYSRMDQDHLALRQYKSCVEALLTDLDVTPSPSTVQLFERIRRHEPV